MRALREIASAAPDLITRGMRFFLLSASLLIASSLTLSAQGPLTPPGPPAPTMKTLEQVEARTPVNAANTPGDADYEFIISQPGSYYLTGNLHFSKSNGVRITAPNVTLDLNGFEVRRTTTNGTSGIEVAASQCTIKNGSIAGTLYGVRGTVEVGGNPARGGTLLHVTVADCDLGAFVGPDWRLESCTAVNNAFFGLITGEGAMVRNCIASKNPNVGIQTLSGSSLINCTASGNGGAGFFVDHDVIAEGCNAIGNKGDGFRFLSRSIVRTCTANGNGRGITAETRSLISGCTANGNQGHGIVTSGDSVIVDNHASDNGKAGATAAAAGIQVSGGGSRIEGNHARANTGTGIRATAVNGGDINVIIRNTAGGNTAGNFNPASGTNFGPLQNAATATSPTANHQF